MTIRTADRLLRVEEYYFSKKLAEVAQLKENGADIINLGIGSPDMPPHPDVKKELVYACDQTGSNHYQSYRGLESFRQAIAHWYKSIYDVELDASKEILPLMGSKEGIMHVSMAFCNPGETVLVPNPCYPAYLSAAKLLNINLKFYNLKEENNWLPNMEEIESLCDDSCRMIWTNYPHMPTGANGNMEVFKQLVDLAKKKNILVVNDNPYSLILNDKPESLLKVEGVSEFVLEMNSLSKSHNMAGFRVGMLCGSEKNINHVLKIKSNFDSGMYKPIQLAASKALALDTSWYKELNINYQKRRNLVWSLADKLNCKYKKNSVGMFVWAKIPDEYNSGEDFSDHLLYNKSVFATPGIVFGQEGKKYIRFSLCATEETIIKAIERCEKNVETLVNI
ncbi:aminotransferase class I/II-fold pyridoxal phosphate-dependent enzyme [Ancylomarina euxinus]|uniref:Aminotransferase n=1 Tax=Ancylomarina euxinus TaxID=2283627 RepID=A0A425XXH4_9BACT|nr:aminotransferase class I/II-fold pyridoxal phosphate-dependent enzyme [Ancylomarina euxinus]MCZ4696118.1 aminotransferase class I/II-fold pyridoxal phosphate-dependent enzyme [Ancylomarina euxinus]MUP16527.1 aminotransferase class I/II-fold pyridoxal phosphate-dependent enzyme [Ancylomarina euxinus]RRG19372.1 aminotransferase class I/II-fold pyridoxal phosphate-dependent enzyme [Ancylomarina euxinus]